MSKDNENPIASQLEGDDAISRFLVQSGDVLGVLPLRNKVLFPSVLMPITVTRPKSQKLVQKAFEDGTALAVFTQREQSVTEPGTDDLYELGVAAKVLRIIPMTGESVFVILQGVERIHLDEMLPTKTYLKARISLQREDMHEIDSPEFGALAGRIKEVTVSVFSKMENMPQEASMGIKQLTYPPMVVNFVAANFPMTLEERQQLLEINDIRTRAEKLLSLVSKEEENLSVKQEIQKKTEAELNKNQREYFLHQQMHAIQKELGDTPDKDVASLRERAKNKHWNANVQQVFEQELKKLERMDTRSAEYPGQLTYLETMLDLPWNEFTEDNLDIRHAQQVLDNDHFGMEDVKERILEHLAVLRQVHTAQQQSKKAADKHKTPILCLYGPPGVGKTSLGKSIATALGRKYARISLGGLHDEAEIRGHRKTYVAAMPGRIIENLKKVQSSNPVFVLDEIDKVTSDFHGDPTSALLEVLDPEQNSTFHDNYLDVDYDLSKVLFIATANSLQTIPRPLLDRMELIEMTGYLQEEKEQICRHYLIPKELEAHGLKSSDLKFSAKAIRTLIDDYTRESGVRELDRQLQSVIRKFIKEQAFAQAVDSVDNSDAFSNSEEESKSKKTLQPEDIHAYLGKPKYSRDRYENNDYTGVVTGLAWTQVGGEILFIETSLYPAKTPSLTLTGNLGDVMKESATIALGYIRAHAADFGIQQKLLDTRSVHLHVPEGAIPKDGPSAGITMTTAMISAFTGKKVRERLAMTGEMTLRGKVLPVGGIKEKILAAKRAGITDIVLCYENEKDVLEIKPEYVRGLQFHYVRDIHEVIEFALA